MNRKLTDVSVVVTTDNLLDATDLFSGVPSAVIQRLSAALLPRVATLHNSGNVLEIAQSGHRTSGPPA